MADVNEVDYCEPGDIQLPHIIEGDMDALKLFIREACDEIDGKLGWIYEVPLDLEALRYHERKLIKTVAVKLARGRYILAISSDESQMNATGLRSIQEGLDELHIIASGDIVLTAKQADRESPDDQIDPTGASSMGARKPEMFNVDSESLFNGFNQTVLGGRPYYVVPDDQAKTT
jgi:hypothetical protein